jgi:hypothetical protein
MPGMGLWARLCLVWAYGLGYAWYGTGLGYACYGTGLGYAWYGPMG